MEKNHKASDPPAKITRDSHFEQIFLSWAFVKTLLEDLNAIKIEEEKAIASSPAQEKQMLYSSFIQDGIELLMTVVVPTNKYIVMDSYKEIINIEGSHLKDLKEWLDPFIKTSLFMHYFNDEIECLPFDLLQEIHEQTRLETHQPMDNILVIDKVPMDEELYPRAWITK
jgi:hypothetical protein